MGRARTSPHCGYPSPLQPAASPGSRMPDAKEQHSRYSRTDPVPEYRPAGLNTIQPEDQSVHKALQPDPALQKTLPQNFRYSDELKFEPGRIQVHSGLFGADLGPEGAPYGRG